MSERLRLYLGTEGNVNELPLPGVPKSDTVTVKLGDVLAALQDAKNNDRIWLLDFADEEITISADLYEIIMAYEVLRAKSA